MNNAIALVTLLRTGGLRSKVGTLLLSKDLLGSERILAAKLNIHYVDFSAYILDSMPTETAFLSLTVDRLLSNLDFLANTRLDRDCILLANFDLPFSKLSYESRMDIWSKLLRDFPYKRNALLITFPGILPNSALLPEGALQNEWGQANRLICLDNANN